MKQELARLILGELAETDRDRLEARLLAEPDLLEQAEAVEAELVDAYTQGELSARERAALEARLRVSPRLQSRLAFSECLLVAGARVRGARPSRGLRELLFAPTRAWAPALAAVLATVAAAWLALELRGARGQLDELRAERDALQAERAREQQARGADAQRLAEATRGAAQEPKPAPRVPVLAVFALGLGAARDESRVAPLVLPRGIDAVRFDVDLEGAEVYQRLRAVLSSEAGATVFQSDGLVPRRLDGSWTVAVTVPADRLDPGAYVLTLEGSRASGEREVAALRELRIGRR